MLDQIITETATRFGLPTTSVAAVGRGLLSFLTNERTGGPEGFLDQFRRAGIAHLITSWFGGKEGRTITPSHVEAALGTNAIENVAASSGLTRPVASTAAAFMLPRMMAWLTPNGALPSVAALRAQILRDSVSRAIPLDERRIERRREPRRWPGWWPWAAAAALALAAVTWL